MMVPSCVRCCQRTAQPPRYVRDQLRLVGSTAFLRRVCVVLVSAHEKYPRRLDLVKLLESVFERPIRSGECAAGRSSGRSAAVMPPTPSASDYLEHALTGSNGRSLHVDVSASGGGDGGPAVRADHVHRGHFVPSSGPCQDLLKRMSRTLSDLAVRVDVFGMRGHHKLSMSAFGAIKQSAV